MYGPFQWLKLQGEPYNFAYQSNPYVLAPLCMQWKLTVPARPNITYLLTLHHAVQELKKRNTANPLWHILNWEHLFLKRWLTPTDALLLSESFLWAYENGCWKCKAVGHLGYQCPKYSCWFCQHWGHYSWQCLRHPTTPTPPSPTLPATHGATIQLVKWDAQFIENRLLLGQKGCQNPCIEDPSLVLLDPIPWNPDSDDNLTMEYWFDPNWQHLQAHRVYLMGGEQQE